MKLWYTNNSPLPATPPPPLTVTLKATFLLKQRHTSNIMIACNERAAMLRADIMHVMHEYEAGEGVPCCSGLIN